MTTAPVARVKPYPAYKDSGVEWLGEIPAHWEVRGLRSTVTIAADGRMAQIMAAVAAQRPQ
ncbi:MAG: hypothetical protein HY527_11190 [Betaproteobacteria bacterium]|nr:hypothetical protein [Betaproteobacteria bacterium]